MPRVLRNYLISFVLIGLFFLVVHLVNTAVEQRADSSPPDCTPAEAVRQDHTGC